jgi:FlaA1/EpsC-like NDP-sugar epimerase
MGTSGEVMVLEMGSPVRILDVARRMITLSGASDIEIVFTGLRPGEKLHEELFGATETDERSKHPLVSHAHVDPLSVDVVRSFDLGSHHLGLLQAFEDWVHLSDPTVVDETRPSFTSA